MGRDGADPRSKFRMGRRALLVRSVLGEVGLHELSAAEPGTSEV
jgi:hypothetical protein